MTKIAGRQVEIGIGIETVAGTPVAAADYFKWDSFSIVGYSDKISLDSARGIRNKSSNSLILKKYGKGSVEFVPTVDIMPYILGLVMGTRSSGAHAGETTVYDHTFSIQNNNAAMKSATFFVKQGGVQTERYSNMVADSFDITVDKDFAKVKLGVLGAFPDTGTITPSYTQDTLFTRNELTAKFGTSVTNAIAASATPLTAFSLSINNNVLFDDAFLSGANTPAVGGFVAGPLEIKGSYTLQFADTTELAKYQANTLNAMVVKLTGANLGVVPTPEAITFKLGKLSLIKAPIEYQIDGLTMLKQEFTVQYDATDLELGVVVTNGYVGTNYQ